VGRWWTYQKERFPIFVNGPLIFVFSLSAVSYSSLLRGHIALPSLPVTLTAFLTCFFFFLLLRIADEFKDYEEDAKYRAYRPVPRGLIKLRELGVLAGIIMLIQLGLALWLKPALVFVLLIVWAYWALMSKEFFVHGWLKDRPFHYLWTHMLIMPLIDLYATACDWLVVGASKPTTGLVWFLIISFFNGVVVEIGRKLRAPEDEEEGVETYSALYGIPKASFMWLAALLVTAVSALFAASQIGFFMPMLIAVINLLATACVLLFKLRKPKAGMGKHIELFSGIWTIVLYLSVGIIPLLLKVWA